MTGGVAHEFNNLLQAIVDSLDVMRDGVRDADRAKRMIELAQRSAFRGKDLTGRLLSYVGKHPIRPEVVDVGEFVRDAVDLFEPLLGETIKIEALIADDLWPIKVDCEQLEIAALNLAINAKDTMVGGGKLTFEASNVHIDEALAAKRPYTVTPGDYVKLAITDTGTGMSQEVRDQAFDPFFTTKDVGKGTGLGLRVRPETLCRITEFSEHESNGRELDEGERVAVEVLPVLGQSAAAVEPGDGAFDHPTPGLDDEALHPIGSLDDLGLEIGQDAGQGAVKDRPLIGAVGEQFPEKGKQTEQGRQQRETAVAILNVGGGDDAVQQQALRIDQNMPLLALDQLAGIEAVAVDASPPFSALFTL